MARLQLGVLTSKFNSMKIWLRRTFALVFISLGISLIFLPFNDSRSGSIEQEVVSLQKIKLLNPDEINIQFPGIEIRDITGPEMNPDNYPDLFRAFINLGEDWINESGDILEWEEFQDAVLKSSSEFCLIVFREGLISCSGSKEEIALTYLGKYNPHIPKISESNLAAYSTIINAVKEIEKGMNADTERVIIPIDEWDQMVSEYLNPMTDSQLFNFNGNFYEPEFQWEAINIEGEILGLQSILKIIGILFFFIGFLVARKLYQQKKEFQQSSRKKAILFHLISLVFIIPAAYMIVNTVLKITLFIPPYIEDSFLIIIGNFFFCVGIPILALLTSRLTTPSD